MSRPTGTVNHNASAPVSGLSEDDRIKANLEHDIKYGFKEGWSSTYTNPKRRPESYFGPISELWDQPDKL